ncbi:MAG TPA: hypothetical protein VN781_04175 [Acidimicrobiales bacterium]|nr:hypothetical protein [Acidimicrobiales bacterium]
MTVTETGRGSGGPAHSHSPTLNHWRSWVTKHPVAGAALVGAIATWVATIFGFWLGGIGLPQLDWPIANGHVVLPSSSSAVQFSAGGLIHGLDGIVFTVLFVVFVFPMLGRSRTSAANLARGVFFGLLLGTLVAGFVVPYVYYPHLGAGLFATAYGWKVPFAIYAWYVVFGVTLGGLYNPLPAGDQSPA